MSSCFTEISNCVSMVDFDRDIVAAGSSSENDSRYRWMTPIRAAAGGGEAMDGRPSSSRRWRLLFAGVGPSGVLGAVTTARKALEVRRWHAPRRGEGACRGAGLLHGAREQTWE
ncbi:alpha/beta-Hydrolases superfamily protein [Striga asiatica]|uniref:Alpha/beta-Hydrolases superfamily protein n=1 Tax=Striga asiatica TaxID=4170 RepID=A0A5A7PK31_STRAF|nr:alpha/beta-Hydrolases superfamily protein [Striga asiatica]